MFFIVGTVIMAAFFILAVILKLAEASACAVSEAELAPLLQNKSKRAFRIERLDGSDFKYASSLKTAISTVEFFSFAIGVSLFVPRLTVALVEAGIPVRVSQVFALTAVTAVGVFLTVTLISIVARHIAIKHALKIALALSGFALLVSRLFFPLSALISAFAGGILKLLRINRHEQESDVSEEAIKSMVDAGSETGTIEPEEKEFIENVFAFNDLTADEIATHRTGITILWTDETPEQWDKTVRQSHHTYFPVCEDKIDNVVGILNSKEYFRLKNHSRDEVMKKAVKNPYYIPESMKANAILKDMKKKREFFAVVIDEYGGLSGIVTVTDLLQCIVGDLYEDESAPSEPEIERLDSKTWKILGQAPLDEAAEALGVNLEGDFDTFAGYVLTMVQQIPDDGAVFTVENEIMTVRVTSVKDRRIQKAMIRLKEEAPDAE